MLIQALLITLTSVVLTAFLSGVYLKFALKKNILDQPNQRSSHIVATPRGGGIAIVVGVLLPTLVYLFTSRVPGAENLPLALFAVAIASLTGFYDDIKTLPVRWRLLVYLAVTIILVVVLGSISIGHFMPQWLSIMLVVLGLMWLVNLYNFMDGIDGLAASEAVIVSTAAAIILWLNQAPTLYIVSLLAVAGSAGGFLLWNKPPAKLFMGDSGSIFYGFIFCLVLLLTVNAGVLSLAVWFILLAAFIADASYTLVWRLWRRENIFSAHKVHNYQILAQYWGSHGKVVSLYIGINTLWLLPLAILANQYPGVDIYFALLAYMPLIVLIARTKALVTM